METLLMALGGILMGLAFYQISAVQIENRTADILILQKVKRKSDVALFIGFTALGFGLIGMIVADRSARFETMVLFCICLCIGWIDFLIRRIPNELVLSIVLCKVLFLCVHHEFGSLLQSLIGLAAALFIFLIPFQIKMPIGTGDIKYAAVVGFYLGVLGFLQVMAVMAAALMVYLVYLLATKKGSWRTAAAMGPYISLGVIVATLFPIK